MRVYYNEFDPFAAAWLRELMTDGLIPKGDVDDRSIVDVRADDLAGYDQCHFFAGIGGWAYALQLAGWEGPVWTGSCPCQPFSVAGRGGGESDPRHLWPEFARLIAECRPPVVFGEQVASKAGRDWLAGVRADLEGMGYGVGAADLCAAGVGAPHIRQRLWWVGERVDKPDEGRRGTGGECGSGYRSGGDGQVGSQDGPEVSDGGLPRGVADAGCREDERRGNPSLLSGATGTALGETRERQRGGDVDSDCGPAGWLGDHQPGLEGYAGDGHDRSQPGRFDADSTGPTPKDGDSRNPWASAVWHRCRDGKARRIPAEPALFPLADGLPNRVGLLRGAGNAIVPQVAAAFVGVYREVAP